MSHGYHFYLKVESKNIILLDTFESIVSIIQFKKSKECFFSYEKKRKNEPGLLKTNRTKNMQRDSTETYCRKIKAANKRETKQKNAHFVGLLLDDQQEAICVHKHFVYIKCYFNNEGLC